MAPYGIAGMATQKNNPVPALILASASPRRLALLEQIGVIPDQIVPANINETKMSEESPRHYVQRMAREKAQGIAATHPDAFILGADTVVATGQRILGKPANRDEAAQFLRRLSGRRHDVMTAMALIHPNGKISSRLVATKVRFQRLDEAMITQYLNTEEWQGKAGGYAIQGKAALFVDWISGSYSGVVGLPLHEGGRLLRDAGLIKLS
jgi:septum formation protein